MMSAPMAPTAVMVSAGVADSQKSYPDKFALSSNAAAMRMMMRVDGTMLHTHTIAAACQSAAAKRATDRSSSALG
eukprot:CAMPEP_0167786908 /NCGR_PEP_ID=MMETSP0111_2-20121227/9094_1 /TAXON_ID=91324 /ORGANISM="Lotharella globosa, Strain CCCM811" /LENGTH=74 /DNA_ID=CAMNT_0007678423 /DNA_START=1133 /DNA_END=1357 /DNA_ORIENTATION=+